MKFQPNSPAARDIAYHLHPFTDLSTHEERGPFIVTRGDGVYVSDDEGKRYIEGLAGLWCTSLGFSEQRLVEAAIRQLEELPTYNTFAHKTAGAVIDLAEKLIGIAPESMSKVFFTNSGSEANDTQVKLVWYYNNIRGRPEKKKIIARKGAYHGITLAAASLTGLSYAHKHFDAPIANILHTACPHYYHYASDGESEDAFATRLADELEQLILDQGPDTVAAFIAEPLLGAGGVITPPKTYFDKVQAVLRKYDVLFIVDEVITGFCRTGNMFACETYGLEPDMMTVAKALSSGYQPIGAVMINEDVYRTLVEGSKDVGIFATGFTYSGHPVPAAVALETLKIYEDRNILGHVRRIAPRFQRRLHDFADHPLVGETRGVGLIGAVELVEDKAARKNFDPARKVGLWLMNRALDHGLIVRALVNDTIAFCPPLIISESQIDDIFDRFSKCLEDAKVMLS
ncbi:MAG: aspartate aminotransferase family protein [Gammaproteobacteria bacterium]|nr:aspartate aminotransferase family protein [Gammaproteobacteria bacterium]